MKQVVDWLVYLVMNLMRFYIFSFVFMLGAHAALGQQKDGELPPNPLEELNVYIPNAFSPNADEANDFWKPVISGPAIEFYELTVLDRNGKEVFTSTDPAEAWNGSSASSDYSSSPSIFLYYLVLNVEGDLENKVYRGHITMVR